jgi:hypothetical protein
MIKYFAIASVILGLQGCSVLGWKMEKVDGVTIIKQERERTRLDIANPSPLKPSTPTWIVITPENQAEVFAKLQEQGTDPVLFGLTDDGYERLSVDTANTRNYIDQLRRILEQYRKYYEPEKKQDAQPTAR